MNPMRSLVRHGVVSALGLMTAVCLALSMTTMAWAVGDPSRTERFAAAKSWGYQLQHPTVQRLSQAPYDVIVIDYSKDGSGGAEFKPEEVKALKRKPDGGERIVLAYMSIGEAETYRFYWDWKWGGTWYGKITSLFFAPSWLGPENAVWGGNFAVRYWDEGWQRVVIGEGGYLDRIVAAGFDGVYLDKIDSCLEAIAKGRPSARDDMRTFVRRIAEAGRKKSPGFLVVPQNGEELLDDPGYVAVIDGMGKEDLLFGEFKEQAANPADLIQRRVGMIAPLVTARKPVLAVEYIDDASTIARTLETLTGFGYLPHFADRDLAHMRFQPVSDRPTPPVTTKKRQWFK